MANMGRIVYVPKSVIDELNNIKKGGNEPKNSEAFKDMVRYAQIGREVEHFRSTMFPFIDKKNNKERRK